MSATQVLAFFDARFCSSGPVWESTHRADHWAYSLNQPWTHSYQPHPETPAASGRYDLSQAEQAAMVVMAARNIGFNGFVLSLLPWKNGYVTGAEFLNPHCDETFGLAFQWDAPDAANDPTRLRRECKTVMAALRPWRHVLLGGRPALIVRNPQVLSDPASVLDGLRQEAEIVGLPGLFIIANAAERPGDANFDALLDPDPADWISCERHLAHDGFALLQAVAGKGEISGLSDSLLNYTTFVLSRMNNRMKRSDAFPRILPEFCNASDREDGEAVILREMNNTVVSKEFYCMFIRKAISLVEDQFEQGKRAIFIDSWNDWRHNSQIEPTIQSGSSLLMRTREAITWGHYLAQTQTARLKARERTASDDLRRKIFGLCSAISETMDQEEKDRSISELIGKIPARDRS